LFRPLLHVKFIVLKVCLVLLNIFVQSQKIRFVAIIYETRKSCCSLFTSNLNFTYLKRRRKWLILYNFHYGVRVTTILAKTNETSSLINNLIYSSPLPPFQCWLRWARNLYIVLSAIDELLCTFFRIYVQHCAGGRGFCLFYWFFIGVSLTFCQDCSSESTHFDAWHT
jgi:hypothetical protein